MALYVSAVYIICIMSGWLTEMLMVLTVSCYRTNTYIFDQFHFTTGTRIVRMAMDILVEAGACI